MVARATEFIAAPIPSRATAFIAEGLARATEFVAANPALPPPDYAIAFSDDCGTVDITVARNWSAETAFTPTIRRYDGSALPAVVLIRDNQKTIIRFTPPVDELYRLEVSATSGNLYAAPVPAYCRALAGLRELNRHAASGGRDGHATNMSDNQKQVRARLRAALACVATGDYATAQSLLASIDNFIADCGCPSC